MPFAPGQSGNPAGRPKNSGDNRLKVRRMLEARSEEIVDKVIEMALEGDPIAIRLVMERVSPKPRDTSNLGIKVDQVKTQKDLMEVVEKVMLTAVEGELPDDQGKTIASLVKTMSELHKLGELEDRIKLLEGNG
jgi:hypothetical protein